MFAPCSSQAKLPKLRYGSASLQRYVSEINRCAYPDIKSYAYRSPARPRLGIGISAFYYSIDPEVTGSEGLSYGDYNNFQRPGFSLSFKVNVLPAFAVYTGIGYVDKKMSTEPTKQRVDFTVDKPGIPLIRRTTTTGSVRYWISNTWKSHRNCIHRAALREMVAGAAFRAHGAKISHQPGR